MSALMIAQLLIQYGPGAITLIEKLVAVWSKPSLTIAEVTDICAVARTSYDDYIKAARLAMPSPLLTA